MGVSLHREDPPCSHFFLHKVGCSVPTPCGGVLRLGTGSPVDGPGPAGRPGSAPRPSSQVPASQRQAGPGQGPWNCLASPHLQSDPPLWLCPGGSLLPHLPSPSTVTFAPYPPARTEDAACRRARTFSPVPLRATVRGPASAPAALGQCGLPHVPTAPTTLWHHGHSVATSTLLPPPAPMGAASPLCPLCSYLRMAVREGTDRAGWPARGVL